MKTLKERILKEMVIPTIKRKSKEKLGDLILQMICYVAEPDEESWGKIKELKEKITNL